MFSLDLAKVKGSKLGWDCYIGIDYEFVLKANCLLFCVNVKNGEKEATVSFKSKIEDKHLKTVDKSVIALDAIKFALEMSSSFYKFVEFVHQVLKEHPEKEGEEYKKMFKLINEFEQDLKNNGVLK